MWATYDDSNFPTVKVTMKGNIKDSADFEQFLQGWLDQYKRKENFNFIFDTREVGWVNIKYAYRMSKFIKELKKNDIEYLTHSYIIHDSWYIKGLLKFIFALQSPVAPVTMITPNEMEKSTDFQKLVSSI